MEKLRYRKAYKQGITALLLCMLLFGSIIGFFIVSKIQYDNLVSGMKTVQATIVDIDLEIHYKGPNEQEIYITYEVDGVIYNREFKTDTKISFAAGRGAHYSVGDKIDIFYDPQDPNVIATPRSVHVGIFWFIFGLFFFVLSLWALWWMIKHRGKFLVTQEEYEKEKLELKKSKLKLKKSKLEQKRKKKEKKKQKRQERKKKYGRAWKYGKIILIILGVLVGAFVLFLLFGALLMALGY